MEAGRHLMATSERLGSDSTCKKWVVHLVVYVNIVFDFVSSVLNIKVYVCTCACCLVIYRTAGEHGVSTSF